MHIFFVFDMLPHFLANPVYRCSNISNLLEKCHSVTFGKTLIKIIVFGVPKCFHFSQFDFVHIISYCVFLVPEYLVFFPFPDKKQWLSYCIVLVLSYFFLVSVEKDVSCIILFSIHPSIHPSTSNSDAFSFHAHLWKLACLYLARRWTVQNIQTFR